MKFNLDFSKLVLKVNTIDFQNIRNISSKVKYIGYNLNKNSLFLTRFSNNRFSALVFPKNQVHFLILECSRHTVYLLVENLCVTIINSYLSLFLTHL